MAGRVSGETIDGMVVRSAVTCVGSSMFVCGGGRVEQMAYLVGESF